jgi:hypothetical protein
MERNVDVAFVDTKYLSGKKQLHDWQGKHGSKYKTRIPIVPSHTNTEESEEMYDTRTKWPESTCSSSLRTIIEPHGMETFFQKWNYQKKVKNEISTCTFFVTMVLVPH